MTDHRGHKWHKARREFLSSGAAGVNPVDRCEPVMEVLCPGCYCRADRVHVFDAPVVYFVLFFVVRSTETVAGCPQCVRWRLWRRLLVSLPTANFLFPIVAPLILWRLMLSHWDERRSIPPEYHEWANLSPPPPEPAPPAGQRERRVLAAFAAVLVAALLMFVVLPRVLR